MSTSNIYMIHVSINTYNSTAVYSMSPIFQPCINIIHKEKEVQSLSNLLWSPRESVKWPWENSNPNLSCTKSSVLPTV